MTTPSSTPAPVLVVGAGPSGLMVAIELARRGVAVRVVDHRTEPSPHSKALAVWPRTFELFRRVSPLTDLEAAGHRQEGMRYYGNNREIATIRYVDGLRATILPQPVVEEFLAQQLERLGGTVERGVTVLGVEQDDAAAYVRAEMPDGRRITEQAEYVIGADGASSTVRKSLGITFDGATYPAAFVVIDAEMEGDLDPGITHYFQSDRGIMVVSALPGGTWRFFTSAPPGTDPERMTPQDAQDLVDERGPGGLRLVTSHWISVFNVHARQAGTVRKRRVFLVGDAAHIHSPAGGQGLNTGIADAHNLAWKMARVLAGSSASSLLDTFEAERRPIAAQVVATADRQTRLWGLNVPWKVLVRDAVLRAATWTPYFRTQYLPTLAGLRYRYESLRDPGVPGRASAAVGSLLDGLPVLDEATGRYLPLRSAVPDDGFTVLVEGRPDATEADELDRLRKDGVHVRALDRRRRRLRRRLPDVGAGATRVTLVRPDGYVAYHARGVDAGIRRIVRAEP